MPRGGTWGYGGGLEDKKKLFQNLTRFGVCYLHEWHLHRHIFWVHTPWGLGRGKKFNFLNMVMLHTKFKGMSRRPGYTEKF